MVTASSVGLRFSVFLIFLVLALGFGILVGPAGFDSNVLWQLRMPRVLTAASVGVGLTVAGFLLQAVFSNPLCEPYTLGVSSGAALGVVLGAWLGQSLEVSGLSGFGFLGAVLFAGILDLISRGQSANRILVAGVMLSFLGSSFVALWLALGDPAQTQYSLWWLLGDLSRARFRSALVVTFVISGLSVMAWFRSSQLDALLLGESQARILGVDVPRLRRSMILLSSMLVGVCVSAAGVIGFVGLVVPHVTRTLARGALHQWVIPLGAVVGAASLVAADAIARGIGPSQEIPVGVVTSILGAPFFLWALLRRS